MCCAFHVPLKTHSPPLLCDFIHCQLSSSSIHSASGLLHITPKQQGQALELRNVKGSSHYCYAGKMLFLWYFFSSNTISWKENIEYLTLFGTIFFFLVNIAGFFPLRKIAQKQKAKTRQVNRSEPWQRLDQTSGLKAKPSLYVGQIFMAQSKTHRKQETWAVGHLAGSEKADGCSMGYRSTTTPMLR